MFPSPTLLHRGNRRRKEVLYAPYGRFWALTIAEKRLSAMVCGDPFIQDVRPSHMERMQGIGNGDFGLPQ